MDIGKRLIAKIVAERSLEPLTDRNIKSEVFGPTEAKRVYERILALQAEHGAVPTEDMLKRDFPKFSFEPVEEPFSWLIDELVAAHRSVLIEDMLHEAVDLWDANLPDKIRELMAHTLSKIDDVSRPMRDVDITQTVEERLAKYEARRYEDNTMTGIPLGISAFDNATKGFQKQQLITFVGPPKAGKSTLMLLATIAAHLFGKKPLLIGFEMSNEEQTDRLDSMISGVSAKKIRDGNLSEEEEKKLRRALHSMEMMKPFIMSNDSKSTSTVSGVLAKIDQYQADIAVVDGVYMMQDELGEATGSPQALTNITRSLKRGAQNKDIPLLQTTQALEWKMDKKKGLTGSSIGYSSSFAQDSDLVIGVQPTEDENINCIKSLYSRNTGYIETYVRWDWETGVFEEVDSPEEMYDSVHSDSTEERF